jgi:hypothetical protein
MNIDIDKVYSSVSTVKDNTKITYKNSLKHLEKTTSKDINDILVDPEQYSKVIDSLDNENKRKLTYTAILSLFTYSGAKNRHNSLYYEWYKHFKKTVDYINEKVKNNEPTQRQIESYVPWEQIISSRDGLAYASDKYLLLAMYTMKPPRRQWDYSKVHICDKRNDTLKENHLVINDEVPYIYLHDYKTCKGNESYYSPLPLELVDVIRCSLVSNPRNYLFVTKQGLPYNHINSFTKWSNSVIKNTLKNDKASINTLRHSYQNHIKKNSNITYKELETIANDMGHSVRLYLLYRFKDDFLI